MISETITQVIGQRCPQDSFSYSILLLIIMEDWFSKIEKTTVRHNQKGRADS